MKHKHYLCALFFLLTGLFSCSPGSGDRFMSYTLDTKTSDMDFYLLNDSGRTFRTIGNLKNWLEGQGKTLVFAVNGGMYKPDYSPVGLYIRDHRVLTPLDTGSAAGNFYLKPNGVFYVMADGSAFVVRTEDFVYSEKIRLATQSGPMLVIDGEIHTEFTKGSSRVNIRNGVGILPDGKTVFVLSKEEVNLYDFADYFRQLGCKNALYLDGLVSRMYAPEKNWSQLDGDFGVIIAVTQRYSPE